MMSKSSPIIHESSIEEPYMFNNTISNNIEQFRFRANTVPTYYEKEDTSSNVEYNSRSTMNEKFPFHRPILDNSPKPSAPPISRNVIYPDYRSNHQPDHSQDHSDVNCKNDNDDSFI